MIQMDFNLFGLQKTGFLTKSNALNNLTTNRPFQKSYALKAIYTTAVTPHFPSPASSPATKHFISSVVLACCKAVKKPLPKRVRNAEPRRK